MTSRQVRRERREAERKAKKAELKRTKAAAARMEEPAVEGPSGPAAKALEEALVSSPGSIPQITDPHVSPMQSRQRERPVSENGFAWQNAEPSTRRAEINRLSGQHSTGPRTPSGKLASSRNSLKHGLASGEFIIPGEDRAAFEALLHELIEEHDPANVTEELLVNEMAQSWWLAQRALRLQNDCFSETGVDEKRLSLFLRYQTTRERAFHKALNTLHRLQKERRKTQVGFVSQIGSVPQTAHSSASPNRSPEQSDGSLSDFVSQNRPDSTSPDQLETCRAA